MLSLAEKTNPLVQLNRQHPHNQIRIESLIGTILTIGGRVLTAGESVTMILTARGPPLMNRFFDFDTAHSSFHREAVASHVVQVRPAPRRPCSPASLIEHCRSGVKTLPARLFRDQRDMGEIANHAFKRRPFDTATATCMLGVSECCPGRSAGENSDSQPIPGS